MKRWIVFAFLLFALPALACGGDVSRDDVETAVTQSANAAATAAHAAQTAATSAALLADQGQVIVETVQASDFDMPDIDVDNLRERANSLRPDENGIVTFILTEEEVNQAIENTQAESETVSLQNARFQFADGQVIMTGEITNPIQAPIQVDFEAEVVNGRLIFNVAYASIGSIQMPTAVLATATTTLNNSIGDLANNLPNGYILQAVTATDGILIMMASQ